jgi:hypothetical protein
MYQQSSQGFLANFFSEFRCKNCGSDAGFASRPRNFFERSVLPLFSLKTVRCGDCYHRSFRPQSVKVRPRREHMNFDQVRAVSDLVQAMPKEPEKEMSESTNGARRIA